METNTIQLLKQAGVKYELKPHETNAFSCEEVARERQVTLAQVVKCMVGYDATGSVYVMLVPGDKLVKLKKVCKITGAEVRLFSPQQLEEKFGVIVGAISPVQFLGKAKFYMDHHLFLEEIVDISSSLPNLGIHLAVEELESILGAARGDIAIDKRQRDAAAGGIDNTKH